MLKAVLAGTTALVIAGGSLLYAQQQPAADAGAPRWRPSAEDMAAFGDARIAGLKAGLKLTAEQEKHWPALEKALRDRAKVRADRFAARASADRPQQQDPIERLKLRAERLTQAGASAKAIADAAGPLYASLDENQKKRFAMLARLGDGGRGQGMRHRFHHRFGGRDGNDSPRGPRPQ
ncbi:MAG: Spy/CpxP family protein refolding chaperone [Pseudolabrys sp.]|nr:Spy/CpxP family protein refolding chaperone [Pseudolabrys sp.]